MEMRVCSGVDDSTDLTRVALPGLEINLACHTGSLAATLSTIGCRWLLRRRPVERGMPKYWIGKEDKPHGRCSLMVVMSLSEHEIGTATHLDSGLET